MRLTSVLATAAVLASISAAPMRNPHGNQILRQQQHRRQRLDMAKRSCKVRPSTTLAPTTSISAAWVDSITSSAWVATTTAAVQNVEYAAVKAVEAATTTSASTTATSSNSDNGAVDTPTTSSGPNGAEWWLMSGVDGSGWTPPYVSLSTVVTKDLSSVMSGSNSVFSACSAYVDTFYSVAAQFGLQPIMLASTAMQESGCNPSATGGNGEAGLMQLGSENCASAPGGNCYDTYFNIYTGAQYLKARIDAAGGNVLVGLAQYNGFSPGGTVASATATQWTDCLAQNNLDYLQQTLNGWYQGVDGHSLGTYRNLDKCT